MPAPFDTLLNTWHAVAARRSGDVALVEVGSGRRWTFAELRVAGMELRPTEEEASGVACPQGQGAAFLIEVLAAWETGRVVCPLEAGVRPPADGSWRGLSEAFPAAVMAKTTSGSTGTPRHVIFSGAQLAADARAIVSTMGLTEATPNVGVLSLAHSYGFSNLVLPLLLHGIPLVLAASPLPQSVRDALEIATARVFGGRPVTLPAVPAMWRAWHAAGVVEAHRIAVAISAGTPLPLDLERRARAETGVKIHNFLGSTECGGIAYDRSDVLREHASLAGTPLDGVTLSVEASGRLVVHSEAVGLGYWPPESDNPATADSPALQPGCFRTGDLAEQHGPAWHLLGRDADTLNLAGRKLHPVEIESLLRLHPSVRECLVFGIASADDSRGEEMVVAVALDFADDDAWSSLPAWLAAQLPDWKRPRHWWRCPDLTADARGKLSRSQWRRRFLAASGPPSRRSGRTPAESMEFGVGPDQ